MARIKNRIYTGTLTLLREGKPGPTERVTADSLRRALFALGLLGKGKDLPPAAPAGGIAVRRGHPLVRLGVVSEPVRKLLAEFQLTNDFTAPRYFTVAQDLRKYPDGGFHRQYGRAGAATNLVIHVTRTEGENEPETT